MKTSFSQTELKWFGPLFGIFGGMLGAIARWKFGSLEVAQGICIFSAVVVLLSYLIPSWRRWFYIAWLAAVFPIAWVVSHLLLASVFYLVVFPIGMLMRMFRYDALSRRFDRDCESYWKKRENDDDLRRYFRQF